MNFEAHAWNTLDNNYNLQFSGLSYLEKRELIEKFVDWNIAADSIGNKAQDNHVIVFRKFFSEDKHFEMFLKTIEYKVNYLK